jgi:hypothetical protein
MGSVIGILLGFLIYVKSMVYDAPELETHDMSGNIKMCISATIWVRWCGHDQVAVCGSGMIMIGQDVGQANF